MENVYAVNSPQAASVGIIKTVAARRRGVGARAVAWCAGMAAGVAVLSTAVISLGVPPVPVPPENPITEAKRVLGKILFWDEQLSTSDNVSCGTCHIPGRAGTENRLIRGAGPDNILNNADDVFPSAGIIRSGVTNDYERDPIVGLFPQLTPRNSRSTIMAAYAPELFVDGRALPVFVDPLTSQVAASANAALESQAIVPILNNREMAHAGTTWTNVTDKLRYASPLHLATSIPSDVAAVLVNKPSYPQLFQQAFGDPAITPARIAFALATYQRTLVSDQSPFDRYVAGQGNAMTNNQIQGMGLFNQAASSCSVCHNGLLQSDNSYRNIGLRPPSEDIGRQAVTGNPADRGKFRTPSLRNVGLKRSFMHNGQLQSLTAVVQYYARHAGALPMFTDNIDPVIPQIVVSTGNVSAIVDFMANALTDPRVAAQTFPFDKPTIFLERTAQQATSLGGGVAGAGGITPKIFIDAPPYSGNPDFRVGLDLALGGANAQLGISTTAPVGGKITPQRVLSTKVAGGSGAGVGLATEHIFLNRSQWTPNATYYLQWQVSDAAAVGGVAYSDVAKITIFCGAYGCLQKCSPADIADDSGGPLPSVESNSGVNEGDYNAFFMGFFAASAHCDIADDSGVPLPPFGVGGTNGANNGGVNEGDYNAFFMTFFDGCP